MPEQNLTPRQLTALHTTASNQFQESFTDEQNNRDLWWRDFVVDVTTDLEYKDVDWFKLMFNIFLSNRKVAPNYRELTGETHRLFTERYTTAIREDKYNLIANNGEGQGDLLRAIEQFASYAPQFPQDLMVNLLVVGATAQVTVWDGLPLFDNAHPRGGVTFDNLLAGALSATTFQAARTAMMRFPSDEGAALPMRGVPTDLLVPPDLEYTARSLMNNTVLPGGNNSEINTIQGMANIKVDALFTDVNDWYLIMNKTGQMKPFTYLKHSLDGDPATRVFDNDDMADIYHNEEFKWELKWQMGIIPNRPEQFIKVVV